MVLVRRATLALLVSPLALLTASFVLPSASAACAAVDVKVGDSCGTVAAVSLTGDAEARCQGQTVCVAASAAGDASAHAGRCDVASCLAASGTGNASSGATGVCAGFSCTSVSGTGSADAEGGTYCDVYLGCWAVSASGGATSDGTCRPPAAWPGPLDGYWVGPITCDIAFTPGRDVQAGVASVIPYVQSRLDQDRSADCGELVDVRTTGHACAEVVSASVMGDADGAGCDFLVLSCVTVSGTGSASNAADECGAADGSVLPAAAIGCVAVSGTGDARNEVSGDCGRGFGDDTVAVGVGCVAVSATGNAHNEGGFCGYGSFGGLVGSGAGIGCLAASGVGRADNQSPSCTPDEGLHFVWPIGIPVAVWCGAAGGGNLDEAERPRYGVGVPLTL